MQIKVIQKNIFQYLKWACYIQKEYAQLKAYLIDITCKTLNTWPYYTLKIINLHKNNLPTIKASKNHSNQLHHISSLRKRK